MLRPKCSLQRGHTHSDKRKVRTAFIGFGELPILFFRTVDDCSNNCKTRSKDCGGWTFFNGKCELKKLSRPGDKVPSVGAVSGDPGACGAASGVTSVKCRYTDNDQVLRVSILDFRIDILLSGSELHISLRWRQSRSEIWRECQ